MCIKLLYNANIIKNRYRIEPAMHANMKNPAFLNLKTFSPMITAASPAISVPLPYDTSQNPDIG